MADVRTIELVKSLEVDFETDQWTVDPQDANYRVGAGLYLMVPVQNADQADRLQAEIEKLRAVSASAVTAEKP